MEKYLFFCPQMKALAQAIAVGQKEIVLGDISWHFFRDGFPKLRIRKVEWIQRKDVYFLASFDQPAEIFRQLAVIYALPFYRARSLTVILPYFPTGTMDRIVKPGEIVTAKTLARMLSVTPSKIPVEIVIYDIHALQELHFFGDNVTPRHESAIPLFKERISDIKDVAIAFPDEGAQKRFGEQFKDYYQILCHKVRKGDKRAVTVKEGDPRGREIVIVDDLVMTGGTLEQCFRALKNRGAQQVSAYATHGIFPQKSWQKFIDVGWKKFWVTDSCPKMARILEGIEPFEIISLQNPIRKIILE